MIQSREALACFGECPDGVLSLEGEVRAPLAQGADFFTEPQLFLRELANLGAHLLPALEQALDLALELLRGLPEIGQAILALLYGGPRRCLACGKLGNGHAPLFFFPPQPRHFLDEGLVGRGEPGVVRGEHGEVELLPLLVQRLVLLRLAGLTLERADLALHLVHDITDALKVLAGRVELSLGLASLLLVARHSRRFLDEDAPLPGLGGEDVIQTVLVHEGVSLGIDAGAGEEILDVAKPAHAFVEQVFALSGAIKAAGHAHLAPRYVETPVIVEDETDFSQSHRLPGRRAVEDHVFHLLSAESLGALLAESPANGVRDVGLAAAVRADDAGNAGEDLDLGPLGK